MSRRESRKTGYPFRSRYWLPQCNAWARSRGRQCRRRVGMRPDGTLHVVCNNHGALTPPYSEREISESGKERIAASMRAYWQRVKAGEVIRPRRKKERTSGHRNGTVAEERDA